MPMNNNTKPVIFLAFANDREGKTGYLRNLPEEARQVHAVLDAAAKAGLCEVVMQQNVTIDTVLDTFQDARYRDRIAIFHYGGHAESYELLLETAEGKSAAADAGGMAAFLGRQRGLQLVFLNGCSTQPQVQGLLDAGIGAVIATAQAIDDTVATDFAVRFYKGLAGGAAVQTAFHEAEAACQTAGGGQPRSVYVKKVISTSAKRAVADRWPWALTPRPGAELVLQWNLPDAVNDPLFGLPPLPPDDLPATPFRNILWFRREDAPIFFGRGYDIRELYQRVTAADAAPIVLYYGQSGVGKSSLLAAGLLPRLEQMQTVVYARRDQVLGLMGALAANVAADLPRSSEASRKESGADLLAAWRALETETGKPLTVILDQVEEIYTRPNAAMPDEMGDFLDALVALFGDPTARPQGRVILGFRKEWLAEIEKLLAERQLPRAKVFLQRLEKRGVVEAVTGPARSERLQQHFGLAVDDDLAGEIADDLLADPSSAVAPTLQILLSKLWKQAKERNYDHPTFDRDLYHDLRRQGLLLGDFLDQQLVTLRTAQPAAVDSGLALDLLAFHTTPLGTAEQRTLAELRATYAHQAMILPDLLTACRDLYLLVDPAENHPDADPASRLAHDTLAPLVRKRFEESDAPGQRARRILENRLEHLSPYQPEDKSNTDTLDERDLMLVDGGIQGMRSLFHTELALLERSHRERGRRKHRDKLLLVTLATAIIVTVASLLFAWFGAQQQLHESQSLVALQQAQNVASTGDLEAALEKLDEAYRLDQAVVGDLTSVQQNIRRIAALTLVRQGEEAARLRQIEQMHSYFERALQMQPPSDTPIYVWVPGGVFKAGSEITDILRSPTDLDMHERNISGYWLGRVETTNAQYVECIEAGVCTTPAVERYKYLQFANNPVAGITFDQAQTYAAWRGGRIPTELEWEKACRGSSGQIFPWGNDLPQSGEINSGMSGLSTYLDVGSFERDISPTGAFDMGGNVMEWTDSAFDNSHEDYKVVRGGSFGTIDATTVRCASRRPANDTNLDGLYGVRIAFP